MTEHRFLECDGCRRLWWGVEKVGLNLLLKMHFNFLGFGRSINQIFGLSSEWAIIKRLSFPLSPFALSIDFTLSFQGVSEWCGASRVWRRTIIGDWCGSAGELLWFTVSSLASGLSAKFRVQSLSRNFTKLGWVMSPLVSSCLQTPDPYPCKWALVTSLESS